MSVKPTLKRVAINFRALENVQYGSPLHENLLKQAIRDLHKLRGLEPMTECPKCKRVGVNTTCPKCVCRTVPDERRMA